MRFLCCDEFDGRAVRNWRAREGAWVAACTMAPTAAGSVMVGTVIVPRSVCDQTAVRIRFSRSDSSSSGSLARAAGLATSRSTRAAPVPAAVTPATAQSCCGSYQAAADPRRVTRAARARVAICSATPAATRISPA